MYGELYCAYDFLNAGKFSQIFDTSVLCNANFDSIQQKCRVDIIANFQGHRITPSWVSFTDDERLIGDAAKNAFQSNPQNTVFDAKRELFLTA